MNPLKVKKIFLILLSAVVVFLTYAETYAVFSIDCGFFGSESPKEGYESSFLLGKMSGVGAGAGIDIKKIGLAVLQARVDISKHTWGEKDWSSIITGMSIKNRYVRSPLFIGLRIYSPELLHCRLYAEAGGETSSDTMYTDYKDGDDEEDTATENGSAYGGGIELKSRVFTFGIIYRQHSIKNPYSSLGPVFGLRF
ncbi:MAG: hypothetical protein JXJ19_09050 [Elusimicrobia bacterium]|nr:hypothetical protein [Elusimicrobiota bacterium]